MLEPGQPSEGNLLDLPNFYDDEELDDETSQSSRPWWRSPRGIAVVAAVLILALVVAGFAVIRSRPTPISYQYATISTGNLVTSVSATGNVTAGTYDVNFSGSGTISQIAVSLGQQVKSGQVLAKLSSTSLQDALNQAQLQADQAYDTEQQALAKCSTEGANAPPDCVQLAENQYAAALQSLQNAEDNLANNTLTAPHAGTVTAINGVVGGTPGTGSSSSTSGTSSGNSAFIVITDLSSFQVLASVDEADIGSVAVNQPVTFTVSAYTNSTFRGIVSYISPIGSSSSSVVTYPVTITVSSATGSSFSAGGGSTAGSLGASNANKLLPGMTANLTIITAQRTGVLLLPASAETFARTAVTSGYLTRAQEVAALTQSRQMLSSLLSSKPNAEQDKPTATVVVERSGSKWVAKPVILGLSTGANYEVLSGLQSGEKVVIGVTGGSVTPVASSGTGAGRGGLGGGGFGGGGFGGGGVVAQAEAAAASPKLCRVRQLSLPSQFR